MADLNTSAPRGRGHGRVRSKKLSTRIDMTPMVDLAFLLLTFFILTTNLQKKQAMELMVPERTKDDPTEVPEKNVITFLLDGDDQLHWYHGITNPELKTMSYSRMDLRSFLAAKQREIPKLVVLVKATDQSQYDKLVRVMDEIIFTKVQRYFITDITPEDENLLKNKEGLHAML
jgi:biopolymer transport protein ExbD